MKIFRTEIFKKEYKRLPQQIQKITDKKLRFFITNPRHPSLRVKKIKGCLNIWEASVTMDYRFTFQMKENVFILCKIGTHKILQKP
ncbi:hypothetical protein KKA09_01095 [Patescibacteria group bacterium]|nr:hypothetical protein [Patescibacteria group bacterium]